MRPIRRFGTASLISDRLSSTKHHDKISSTLGRPSWTSTVDEDRRKLQRLVSANTLSHHSPTRNSEKENRRLDEINGNLKNDKTEVIINTPAFQLVCDRRRIHPRHSSADVSDSTSTATTLRPLPVPTPPSIEKQPKSALKKSQNGIAPHRSRWTAFARRSVSFADDKGLQLTEIRLIDLAITDHDHFGTFSSLNPKQASGFIADFILPPAYRRLRALQSTDTSPPLASSQIALESYTSSRWSVTGVIAVRSTPGVSAEKRVFVRFTYDQWTTSMDNDAVLAPDPASKISPPTIDRYSFTLPFPLRPQTGSRLEFKFGVRMPAGVGGVLSPITYWDDNHGSNFSFTFV